MPRAGSRNSKNVILGSSWSNQKWCSPAPRSAESTARLPDWFGHIWDDQLISSAGPSVPIAKGSVDRCSSIAFMELPRCCHIKLKTEVLATGCAVVKLHCLPFTLGHVREDPKEIVRTSLTILWFKSDHATPPSGRMHVDHLKSIDFRSCDHDSPGVADCASELKRVGNEDCGAGGEAPTPRFERGAAPLRRPRGRPGHHVAAKILINQWRLPDVSACGRAASGRRFASPKTEGFQTAESKGRLTKST
jgi:hypothetical protein